MNPCDRSPESFDRPRRRRGRPAHLALLAMAASALAAGAVWAAVPEAPPLPGRLVYSRAKAFQWNLFLSDADGAGESQLTAAKSQNARGDDQPRWSPNGREITYANFSKDGDKAFIWRVPFTGGTATPVATVNADDAGFPAWGPDSDTIIFAGARDSGGPSTLDLKVWTPGRAWTLLDTAEVDEREPDWSRDGERIAYAAQRLVGGNAFWSIRMVGADGQGDEPLFDQAGLTARNPRWSPDGKRLAFVTYANEEGFGRGTLWTLDVATREMTEIVRSGVANAATWSPDGEWLLVYNTLQTGLEFPDQPTPTSSPPGEQLLGLYLVRLSDRALFRLKNAAGGTGARSTGYEWGQVADWTGGTYTPTVEATETATPTPTSPTNTPAPSGTPTPTRTASPTPSSTSSATPPLATTETPTTTTPEQTPTTVSPTPETLPPIYLPVAHRGNGNGVRR